MKIVNMRKVDKGKIKAFFHVEHEGFLMRDFKLMESQSGLWVSFPKRSYQHQGQVKWEPVVEMTNPDDKTLIELLSALARDEYQGAK